MAACFKNKYIPGKHRFGLNNFISPTGFNCRPKFSRVYSDNTEVCNDFHANFESSEVQNKIHSSKNTNRSNSSEYEHRSNLLNSEIPWKNKNYTDTKTNFIVIDCLKFLNNAAGVFIPKANQTINTISKIVNERVSNGGELENKVLNNENKILDKNNLSVNKEYGCHENLIGNPIVTEDYVRNMIKKNKSPFLSYKDNLIENDSNYTDSNNIDPKNTSSSTDCIENGKMDYKIKRDEIARNTMYSNDDLLNRFYLLFSKLISMKFEPSSLPSPSLLYSYFLQLYVLFEPYTDLPQQEKQLYPSHEKTSFFQKLILTIGSAGIALYNPLRGDMIAVLSETTGYPALEYVRSKMIYDKVGSKILMERPRINENTVNLDILLNKYPHNSFGYHYAVWMKKNGFCSNKRTQVRFVDDEELAYILQRYREVHDFWHVLAGLDVSVEEELAIKILDFLQTRLPMAMLSFVVTPIRLDSFQRSRLLNNYFPWAWNCNKNSVFLLNVEYESLLKEDIDMVREKLNFIPYYKYQ